MQEGAASESSPCDADLVQSLDPAPFGQGLLANLEEDRAASFALPGAHDMLAPLVLDVGASPTRNGVEDLNLFAVVAHDQATDEDDALVAGVGGLVLILVIVIAVIVLAVVIVMAVILILRGWMRVGCARLCGVHRAPSLWARLREAATSSGPFSCPCTLKCSTLYSPLPATASYQKGVVGTATEELLSLQEAADRLGVSVYTVRRWIKDGKLRAIKPGKEYRVRQSDLEEFLRSREVHPKAPDRSPFEPTFNDMLGEERRLGYLRAWRAFVYKLIQRWEETPPKTAAEVGVVSDTMQALLNEGAFQRPPETLTTRNSREASEWLDLSFLFRGIDRLNKIADAVQEDAEAERRRATFREIEGRMAG